MPNLPIVPRAAPHHPGRQSDAYRSRVFRLDILSERLLADSLEWMLFWIRADLHRDGNYQWHRCVYSAGLVQFGDKQLLDHGQRGALDNDFKPSWWPCGPGVLTDRKHNRRDFTAL